MAKKITGIILVLALIISLSACGGKEDNDKPPAELAGELLEKLEGYYTGKKLTDYKELAALTAAGFDLSLNDWSGLVKTPQEGLESYTKFLLSVYFLGKAGIDISEYDTERYLGYLSEAITDIEDTSTTLLCEMVLALTLYEREFDCFAVADSLLSRQDVSGGFYDYPKKSGETQKVKTETSAYALMAYQTIRTVVWSAKYNDTINDSTMEYLFYQIDETTDYTVKDHYGKASATATSLCLTALLSAGMTPEGNNALCLIKALKTFEYAENKAFRGFKEYYTDKAAYNDANIHVLFAVVTLLKGNPLTVKTAKSIDEVTG